MSNHSPADINCVDLADIQHVLALFAEGIMGRYFHVKSNEDNAEASTTTSLFGAAHDAHNLYLPPQIDWLDRAELNSAIYRLLILQQLGFRLFDTYSFSIDTAREKLADLASRPLPSHYRESDLEIFFQHFEHPDLMRSLFLIIESSRVERQMLEKYPGARKYRHLLQPEIDRKFDPTMDGIKGELYSLQAVLNHVSIASSSLVSLTSFATKLESTVYDSASSAVTCYEILATKLLHISDTTAGETEYQEEGLPLDWLQRQVRLEDWEQEVEEMNMQIASFELLPEENPQEAKVGDGKDEGGSLREIDIEIAVEREQTQRRIEIEKSAIRHALGEQHENTRSFLYDEWDYLNRTYLKGWCRVFEESLIADNEIDSSELVDTIKPLARSVGRQFEQIRPAGYQRINKVSDGDELYLNAVIDARADLKAGNSPDERVYSRRERLRRDVGAVFLVDLSASTDDPVEDAENDLNASEEAPNANLRDPYEDDEDDFLSVDYAARMAEEAARRRIIDIQREAVALMATALERLGDMYAVYGFSGYGADCVEFYVAKEFTHALDKSALDAIAAMKPKRSTRMGPAIRHALRKLDGAGTASKVLMIVSDGFPQDCDYGPERGNHEYGLQDTAQALREAAKAGVETFCVTVDRSGNDYLKRMCPENRYMVIEETTELPEALQKAYRQLTMI